MAPFARNHKAPTAGTLPLFPLRTVLFPGGMLPLRIFEQRYVGMAKRCISAEAPFGVCLITEGGEVLGTDRRAPTFARIGTLARIVDWDMPQLGILQVTVQGESRFRVVSHEVQDDGLVIGETVPIPAEATFPLPERHRPLAQLVLRIGDQLGAARFPATRVPGDASWVGYRLAEAVPLPPGIKQDMLEINDCGIRLQLLERFLRQQRVIE